ncbi:hypothetical protein B9Q01_03270 [Candidatus Marsarchaeota G1 archaeon OSP_D]|uniref:Uncharacterized protein n=2 Tax=Candidatus Marsarchaeota group 1 TaxID=2203770 RepID=A0A2R6AC00_9ARCH|nr:MAG: hypothetical protein B9Q01_03270 [Candidatus Marsarchaeota G1 archaeon OSP_D]PSN89230.1 MAG: hypothetical protein B9Q00_02455 [Candidatus Marsarchaeota G1 archaeon OSP_C]
MWCFLKANGPERVEHYSLHNASFRSFQKFKNVRKSFKMCVKPEKRSVDVHVMTAYRYAKLFCLQTFRT